MSDERDISTHFPEDAFDPAEIEDLVEDVGAQAVARLLMTCIGDIRTRAARLGDLPSEDIAAGHALAHQLKGLFGQFGALKAAEEAAALETCVSPQAFVLRRQAFQGHVARALVWFEDWQASLAARE
jgi:hypothetical protein